ncbi:uncharacterized protein LOC126986129 isoform X2 [Eriocheir sinensis]|uniref:uncharacterized protein LOC126986129 isoform X2 n=1 Tax=Eriocheir sinensis TaxID=95602 RepID=UPI0021C59DAC|nr:uncharacterized protein LOC126986129 isoform X2 [Eriocheir sinensis]XP_050697925.1 uncharacterized protein LOC126986129 isoform X2 [Eriocheir sinensis]
MTHRLTTPFEDLILGSQFLPALATVDRENGEPVARVGVLQCRRCSASFLQVKEALSHYRLHIFETHKEHFTVVVGGACPLPGCVLGADKNPTIHFHCAYCSFTSTEIMDLPLHMEKRHLAFYREVSLVLRGDDIQRTKVYTCGECGIKIQGTVSIVRHLLAHDNDTQQHQQQQKGAGSVSLVNGGTAVGEGGGDDDAVGVIMVNGDGKYDGSDFSSGRDGNGNAVFYVTTGDNGLVNGCEEEKNLGNGITIKGNDDGIDSHFMRSLAVHSIDAATLNNNGTAPQTTHIDPDPLEILPGELGNIAMTQPLHESMQVEINPLDILTTVMEEDQRSDNPVFPPEHFLLTLPAPAHFLEGAGDPGPQEEMLEGPQESQEQEEDAGSIEGYGDVPSDILLDHPGVYNCDKCEEMFRYQHQLVSHKHQVHQSLEAQYECQVCGLEFPVVQELKRHMVTHAGSVLISCGVCGQTFPDRPSLKAHTVTHGGSTERSNKCESCSVEFASKSELTRHIVKYQGTCNPNKSEGVRCATCGEDLPTLEALKVHRRTAHPTPEVTPGSGKKGFECDYCGKTFNCRSNLRDHLVVHTGEKPYPCDICGKSFSFIHNMKTHRLTHNEGRNEVCPYCDKAYKSKISLYYHMKKGNCKGLSTKEVPEGYHRCTECLQMFASEERYKIHKDKGHCQVSHRCQHCGLRCSTEVRLHNHLQKGLCLKKESPSSTSDNPPKRRRGPNKEREKPQEEIVCDRCNYTKDCCCTFSCKHCGKRVFSIMAYTNHQDKTCSVLKQRRERIRMAIMEKRRRREDPTLPPLPDSALLLPETPVHNSGRFALQRNLMRDSSRHSVIRQLVKRSSSSTPEERKVKVVKVTQSKIETLFGAAPTPKPSTPTTATTPTPPPSTTTTTMTSAPAAPVTTTVQEEGEGDDSSSGSLTDLSTFTSPNILQPVTHAGE